MTVKKGKFHFAFNEGGTKGIVLVASHHYVHGYFFYVAIGYKSKWLRWSKAFD